MRINEVKGKNLIPYNIFLVGFMGTGKTTVANRLHHLLDRQIINTDDRIVEMEGVSIPKIFEKMGESYFRDCESKTLIEIKQHKRVIVSCGGGIVLREKNIELMRESGKVVLLTATPETVLSRVKHRKTRPILNGNMNTTFIAGLLAKREEYYLAAADVIVKTDGKSIDQICEEIVTRLTDLDLKK